MKFASFAFSLGLFAFTSFAAAATYNASSGVLPAAPDWNRFDANTPIFGPSLGFNATQSVSGGVYQMDTTDQGKYTFWYNSNQALDHTKTVEIAARLKVLSNASANPTDRAGLAIALTDDRNYYNEFYLSPTEVFLNKKSGTTRVRDTAYAMDTTSAFHDYLFRLQGDTITIFVDNVQRLSGTIFDASDLSGVPTLVNWASIGDITTSAAGSWQMQSMSVTVSVPEPATILSSGLLVSAIAMRRRL